MLKLGKLLTLNSLVFLSAITTFAVAQPPANAFSVCGLITPERSFKTESRLITICRGEATFQMIITFHDGTGYQRIPVQQEGNLFRGTDGQHNYIIDDQTFVIGTDGEPPIRERVIESQ